MAFVVNVQVWRNGVQVGRHRFDSALHRTVKIGRMTTAQLQLDDPGVGRLHAALEFVGEELFLVDMGTPTGCVVNGTRVQKVRLKEGDQIVLADTQLKVFWGDASVEQRRGPGPTPLQGAGASTIPSPEVAPTVPSARALLPQEEPVSAASRVLELRVYWGDSLLHMHHYREPRKVTLGETVDSDIFVSTQGLPVDPFPLVRYLQDEYVITCCAALVGEVELEGKAYPLAQLLQAGKLPPDGELAGCHQLVLPATGRCVLHWGGLALAMRFVAPNQSVVTSAARTFDFRYINTLMVSVCFHLAMLVTLTVYPYDAEALKIDLFGKPDRFASLILEAPKETKSTKDMLAKIKKSVEEKKEQIQKPQEQEKKDLLKITGKQVVPKSAAPKKSEAERRAEVAQKFSMLFGGGGGGGTGAGGGALLGGGGGGSLAGSLANVIGTTGTGSSSGGLAGLGIRGTGPLTGGGMGTSRGIAGIGTAGRLGGGGLGYGAGVGIGAHQERDIVGISTPVVMGALPPEVIKKVINDNKNQIRYCYEVELQRNQNLEGRVMVSWVISPSGSVDRAWVKESTLKNAAVESCIVAKIRTWKFPAPAGGGVVEVNYPFVFKAS